MKKYINSIRTTLPLINDLGCIYYTIIILLIYKTNFLIDYQVNDNLDNTDNIKNIILNVNKKYNIFNKELVIEEKQLLEIIKSLNDNVNLDYNIYSKIITDKIFINPNILNNIKELDIDNKWIKLYESKIDISKSLILDPYEKSINMENYEYSHYTLFQSKFSDVGRFSLYLSDTYPNLLIPNLDSYVYNNITFMI
jgi:hypothetical protein